ncbi:MAG: class I SAM-dependent methyltransferase [Vicinamibacterales bacterium]
MTAATAPANFDSLARLYLPLERLAFGRALDRTREALLPHLASCRRVLILGEGDGRFLARLLRASPHPTVECVDASRRMIARAAGRLSSDERARVTFRQADARTLTVPPASVDAVVTCFFLDCFTAPEVEAIVAAVAPALRPGGRWLWADFAVPPHGLARWQARAWLPTLYAFFRWRTGISARALPPAHRALTAAGLAEQTRTRLRGGLLEAALFIRPVVANQTAPGTD